MTKQVHKAVTLTLQASWTHITTNRYPKIRGAGGGKVTGTSLVVHWLRIGFAMQGTPVRSPVGELRSHMLRGNY